MLLIRTLLICMMLTGGADLLAVTASTPAAFACPLTTASDSRPDLSIDPFEKDAALHHEDGLWVTIPEDGIIQLTPDDAITFGPLTDWRSESITWLREDGVEGFVDVSGQRLDAESEFSPQTPLSPQRQYVRLGPVTTGLAFPSDGCWEVTGTVGGHSITWVVEVRFVDDPVATPAS